MASSRMAGSRLSLAAIWRLIACAALLCALGLTIAPGHAAARTPCQGNTCLPEAGSNYTFEAVWNCGQIHSEVHCYYKETTSLGSATTHTWGFGSASYSGEGTDRVTIEAGTPEFTYFGGTGTNLMRACYWETCHDQEEIFLHEVVWNEGFHTISGHGEA